MVKSKSAGYICPSLKSANIHRFSLIEDANNLDETEEDHKYLGDDSDAFKSLLPQSTTNSSGCPKTKIPFC